MWRFLVVTYLHGGPPVFALAAALALFVLGIGIYASLIRHVIRGPMLSQILSTFGLALLLRYSAFFIFSANFVSLPQNSLSGTIDIGGIFLPTAQLRRRRRRDHADDRASSFAHPHHRRQHASRRRRRSLSRDVDGHSAGSHAGAGVGPVCGCSRHCRRLAGDGLPVLAVGRRDLGLIAFVVVALGGFGSVLGSLYAGLIIGLIQAVSAYRLGAIYKDIVVYGLFVGLLWFRPQGLMGKA